MAAASAFNNSVDQGSGLANLTDITILRVGDPPQQFVVHSTLLTQSSKWLERFEQDLKDRIPNPSPSAGSTAPSTSIAKSISIPPPHTSGAVDIFVKYLYQKDVIPHSKSFSHHGIEAFLLSQLLESPDFTRCCERALEHALEMGNLEPSLQQLQNVLRNTSSSDPMRSRLLQNVASRMLDLTYPFQKGDEILVDGWTWRALCSAIALNASKNASKNASGWSGTGNYFEIPSAFGDSGTTFSNGNNIHRGFGSGFGSGFGISFTRNDTHNLPVNNESNTSNRVFGQVPPSSQASSGSLFGNNSGSQTASSCAPPTSDRGLFGNLPQNTNRAATSLFGNMNSTSPPFGSTLHTTNNNTGGFPGNNCFGNSCTTNSGSGLFGNNSQSTNTPGFQFGQARSSSAPSMNLFGSNNYNTAPTTTTSTGGLFGNSNATNQESRVFGHAPRNTSNTSGGLFGNNTSNTTSSTTNFGSQQPQTQASTFNSPLWNGSSNNGTNSGGFQKPNWHVFGSARVASPHHDCFTGQPMSQIPCRSGTNVVPFAPTVEKEANGTTSFYNNITFMEPYHRFSTEELRLVDYNSGRQTRSQQWGSSNTTNLAQYDWNAAERENLRMKEPELSDSFSHLIRELREQLSCIQKDTEAIKVRQEKQEQKILDVTKAFSDDGDSNASTPAIVLTPTSSAAASPFTETVNVSATETDGFINIQSEAPTTTIPKKVHFANDINNLDTTEPTKLDSTENNNGKAPDNGLPLSIPARMVHDFLKEHSSPSECVGTQHMAEKLGLSKEQVLVSGRELMGKGLISPPKVSLEFVSFCLTS